MVEKIKIAHIPLSEIPSYLSFDHPRPSTFGSQERREAVEASIEETLKSTPGKVRIIRTKIDLSCLKEHLARILPTGTNLDEVLDAYKKFLTLKVICGDISVPQKFSPSPLVDQVWHAHMEFPQNYYMVCCFAINSGQIIEHLRMD